MLVDYCYSNTRASENSKITKTEARIEEDGTATVKAAVSHIRAY